MIPFRARAASVALAVSLTWQPASAIPKPTRKETVDFAKRVGLAMWNRTKRTHGWRNKRAIAIDTAAFWSLSLGELMAAAYAAGHGRVLNKIGYLIQQGDYDRAGHMLEGLLGHHHWDHVSIGDLWGWLIPPTLFGIAGLRVRAKERQLQREREEGATSSR